MYSHAMGDLYSMQVVTGEADVTVSLMFLIDGEKTRRRPPKKRRGTGSKIIN
jgi:hypothetical protein